MDPGYRADDRPPADIKKDNGFTPWYQISDPAVLRQLMEFVAGTRTWANCSFKPICEKCRVIKRHGKLLVICQNARHKQTQG